ncbi:ferric iron reductase, partial [Francisella tularensis subsp. holarctica]|uniref:ferric iron reductase n=1 Tax=Francisella tularensis TaxID=263 RepID=UPI002381B15B
ACLDLYLLYGIALEAHQQNTLVVFKVNMPQKLLIRDLGGMRLHLPSFESSGFHFPKDTFSLTFTNSQSITRRKFIHACLQSNIGELVIKLSS